MQEFVNQLTAFSCIRVEGEQCTEYLQGQLTIDVTKQTEQYGRFGAHCDFKGKTWSTFYAIKDSKGITLVVPSSARDASMAELKKYGVFSKVEISAPDYAIYGLGGAHNIDSLQALFPTLSNQHLASANNQNGWCLVFNDNSHRALLILTEKGKTNLGALFEQTISYHDDAFELLEIQAGIGNVQQATANQFVPQMMNLQALNAIDFDKGCYMGQETIARTKFLGKNKRAAYILHAMKPTSDCPQAGDSLEKSIGENWRTGGTVLRAVKTDTETCLIAVLANDTQVDDVLRLKSHPEALFNVVPLPYSIDDQ